MTRDGRNGWKLWLVVGVVILLTSHCMAFFLLPKAMHRRPSKTFGSRRIKLASFDGNFAKSWSATAQEETLAPTAENPFVLRGNVARYVSDKGMTKFGVICNETDSQYYLLHNDIGQKFQLPKKKVKEVIYGDYDVKSIRAAAQFGARSTKFIEMANELWGNVSSYANGKTTEDTNGRDRSVLTSAEVCEAMHGKVNRLFLFVTEDSMRRYGTLFFHISTSSSGVTYIPLPKDIVAENLKANAILQEFRFLYKSFNKPHQNVQNMGTKQVYTPSNKKGDHFPEHIKQFLRYRYVDSLKEFVYRKHPLAKRRVAKRPSDASSVQEAENLLKFLGLAPTSKNAKSVLEKLGFWSVHQNIEAEIAGLQRPFPSEVSDEAFVLLNQRGNVFDIDIDRRMDLMHLVSYSIDNESAGDIDDAISIESLENGHERVWIHIADVSRWMSPKSALVREAKERTSTVYMPDLRVPMFPEKLSSDLFSLTAPAEPYVSALSCGVELDSNGEIISHQLCMSKIKPAKRVTYHQVDNILNAPSQRVVHNGTSCVNTPPETKITTPDSKRSCNDCESQLVHDISRLHALAQSRLNYRKRHGAVDVYLRDKTDLSVSAKGDGVPPFETWSLSGYFTWANRTSVSLVTEYMILMSHCAGLFAVNHSIPVVFREQSAKCPLPEHALELQPNETSFVRTHRLLPLMNQARDSREAASHLSSGSHNYVPCTSPIRRYHDLYNHYLLKHALRRLHHQASSTTTDPSSSVISFPSSEWKDLDPFDGATSYKSKLVQSVSWCC